MWYISLYNHFAGFHCADKTVWLHISCLKDQKANTYQIPLTITATALMCTIVSRLYNTCPVVWLPLRGEGGDVTEALNVFCLFYPCLCTLCLRLSELNKGEESRFTIRVNYIHNDAASSPTVSEMMLNLSACNMIKNKWLIHFFLFC